MALQLSRTKSALEDENERVALAYSLKRHANTLPGSPKCRMLALTIRNRAGLVIPPHWKFPPPEYGPKVSRAPTPVQMTRVPRKISQAVLLTSAHKLGQLTSPFLGPTLPGTKQFKDAAGRTQTFFAKPSRHFPSVAPETPQSQERVSQSLPCSPVPKHPKIEEKRARFYDKSNVFKSAAFQPRSVALSMHATMDGDAWQDAKEARRRALQVERAHRDPVPRRHPEHRDKNFRGPDIQWPPGVPVAGNRGIKTLSPQQLGHPLFPQSRAPVHRGEWQPRATGVPVLDHEIHKLQGPPELRDVTTTKSWEVATIPAVGYKYSPHPMMHGTLTREAELMAGSSDDESDSMESSDAESNARKLNRVSTPAGDHLLVDLAQSAACEYEFQDDSGDEGDYDELKERCDAIGEGEFGTRQQMLGYTLSQLDDLSSFSSVAGVQGPRKKQSPRATFVPDIRDTRPETRQREMFHKSITMVHDWETRREQVRVKESRLGRRAYNSSCRTQNIAALPIVRAKTEEGECMLEYPGYNMGSRAVKAFAASLMGCSEPQPLHRLNLSGNSVDSGGCISLMDSIRKQDPASLKHLDLSNNKIGDDAILSIAMLLAQSPALEHLNLGRNKVSDEAAAEVLEAVMHCPKARVLAMSHSSIAHVGAAAAAEVLKSGETKLEEVDLSYNQIRGQGAKALGRALLRMPAPQTLTNLNLSWNHLGDEGCALLARVTEKPACQLVSLDVSGNEISTMGATMFATSLLGNLRLESMVLNHNPIGVGGARAIARTAIRGKKRRKWELAGCDFMCDAVHPPPRSLKGGCAPFSQESPGGDFVFDLSEPWERCLAQQLLDTAHERTGRRSIPDGGSGKCVINNSSWGWQGGVSQHIVGVPTRGIMGVSFIETHIDAAPDVDTETLERLCELLRVDDGSGADMPRLKLLRALSRLIYIAPTDLQQILKQFSPGDSQLQACVILYGRMVGEQDELVQACCNCLGQGTMAKLQQQVGELWHLCSANSCGHYTLNLGEPCDRNMLDRLIQISFRQKKQRERNQPKGFGAARLPDLSQKGNGECFRNELYRAIDQPQYRPFQLNSDAPCLLLAAKQPGKKKKKKKKKKTEEEDQGSKAPTVLLPSGLWEIGPIPNTGVIEFDIVPFSKPPWKQSACPKSEFETLVSSARHAMRLASEPIRQEVGSDFSAVVKQAHKAARFEAKALGRWLRQRAANIFFNPSQVVQLLALIDGEDGCLPGGQTRESMAVKVDLLMAVWNQTLERHNLVTQIRENFLLWSQPTATLPLPELIHDDWRRVQRRIGQLALFSPFLPEAPYNLDLSNQDELTLMGMLLKLAAIEPNIEKMKEEDPKTKLKVGACFSEFEFKGVGKKKKKVKKLPETWLAGEAPTAGTWNCVYRSEPEWVSWKVRNEVATRMLGWQLTEKQSNANMEAEYHIANKYYKAQALQTARLAGEAKEIVKAEDRRYKAERDELVFLEAKAAADCKAAKDEIGYGKKPSPKQVIAIENAKETLLRAEDTLNHWKLKHAKDMLVRVESDDKPKLVLLAQEGVWRAEERLHEVEIERAERALEETKQVARGEKPDQVAMCVAAVEIGNRQLHFAEFLRDRAQKTLSKVEAEDNEKATRNAQEAFELAEESVTKKQQNVSDLEAEKEACKIRVEQEAIAEQKRKAALAKKKAKAKREAEAAAAAEEAAEAEAAAKKEAEKQARKAKLAKGKKK